MLIVYDVQPHIRGKLSNQAWRVLLTGGAGFIGSHVAEGLLRQGAELTIVDDLDEFYSPDWKRANLEEVRRAGDFQFLQADICDPEPLRKLFAGMRFDALVHLAALAGVRPSLEQPRLYERVNVAGTLNLLDLCREFGVSKVLFGSSSSVYGVSNRIPFSEAQADLRPISPYAATKLAGELLCYTYAHLYRLSVVCLRFFTVYGPRQRPDLAIHKFTSQIESGKPIRLYGDGNSGRDYTYVDDIVAGVLGALEYLSRDGTALFEVFNLGNSHPVKLAEMVAALERATGRTAKYSHEPDQPGDVPLTWADISKASRLLGYKPATSLDEGLQRFVTWYRATPRSQRA
jgi:UDP-glucuronate 4-epimerase